MSKPSFFQQLEAVVVNPTSLIESPRHWNCGLFRYADRLWMSYRFHLKQHSGRCATAIVELDEATFQPKGKSEWLKLSPVNAGCHHEDARLFLFRGEPYLSYTEMSSYQPGRDYSCVMKYAKLRFKKNKWEVEESWRPNYGRNEGRSKEKNWVFFEHDDELHAIYNSGGDHKVIRLKGDRVDAVYDSMGPAWHFGPVRGGTPPVMQPDGTYLTVFHSSLPTEKAPHYVRYYAAAYTFDGKPPFTPLRISTRPLMAGSESDGHKVDPRYADSWKPWVVFPCGLVEHNDGWLVSLGVNDWQCAVATLKPNQLFLGAANGSDIPPRYFYRKNGTLPVPVFNDGNRRKLLEWTVPRTQMAMASGGVMVCENPREAQEVAEFQGVQEITYAEFIGFTSQRIEHQANRTFVI